MANIHWSDTPSLCIASVDDVPMCSLKLKDIGGWTASWTGERLWAPPSHLPKATPQPTKFFTDLGAAKAAVEQALAG